ncbi:hypothetical protein [uncultured Cytophaga sp.]|uniref:hypothetical protein n=1 Tax=uncultured Cytophaga sp. TaxID=160238 RepID=UPI00260BB96B|nr:hypothetical protein [uncultured Cytophaga sp.]
MKLLIKLIFVFNLLSCQNYSNQDVKIVLSNNEPKVVDKIKTATELNKPKNIFIDSTKIISFKLFKIIFLEYNNEFKMWYYPKLIINNDTLQIKDLPIENGSELSIDKSPNGKYFVLDNIIKGYVEDDNGNKILHENYTCVIINVKEAKVEQFLQSECDGVWNERNEWISSDNVIFSGE